MGRNPGDVKLKINKMKTISKNRRMRRRNVKPTIQLNGFRNSSRTTKLLTKFFEVDNDPNQHEGLWLMKNIKSNKDTIGFPGGLRKVCSELINYKELYDFCEIEKFESEYDVVEWSYKNKNEDITKLLQFSNILHNILNDNGIPISELNPNSFSNHSYSQTCNLNHRSSCYFLKVYKNMVTFSSDKVEFDLSWMKDGIEVTSILVKDRFNGTGTKVLECLKQVSEITNTPLYLFPIDYKGVFNGGTKGLKRWYSKNGFNQVGNLPVHSFKPVLGMDIKLPEVPKEILEKTGFMETELLSPKELINEQFKKHFRKVG